MAIFTTENMGRLIDLVDEAAYAAEMEGDRFVLVINDGMACRPRTFEQADLLIQHLNARILRARNATP